MLLSIALLLLAFVVFWLLPDKVAVETYRVPVLAFLSGLVLAAIGNILIRWIQGIVSREAVKALREPIDKLLGSVKELREIQVFTSAGLVAIYPNRASAMQRFRTELEREDKRIDFVGTSLQGCLDPAGEGEAKRELHELLLKKRMNGVEIRGLLMHPGYGEFRERVENRATAAVAKDIQATLRFLVPSVQIESGVIGDSESDGPLAAQSHIMTQQNVRLYRGVNTAFAIFTSRSMLANLSTLSGPVYNNFTLIIDDVEKDPNSIFKRFRQNHFEEPWRSEKTVRLTPELLRGLLATDFADKQNRFQPGAWPRPAEDHRRSAQDSGHARSSVGSEA
ncbi:MAG: hypothetical protein R6V05_13810 [Candidatus Brocadiia bacterium]